MSNLDREAKIRAILVVQGVLAEEHDLAAQTYDGVTDRNIDILYAKLCSPREPAGMMTEETVFPRR